LTRTARALAAVAARGATVALVVAALVALASMLPAPPASAQCLEYQAQVYDGVGQTTCPCFIQGEEAGTVFDNLPILYPIKITKVGIGWGSAYGGQPQSIEQAFHIYNAGLPNPGTRIFTQLGPVLTDGAINEYNIEAANVIVNGEPFSVTLEFLNDNANMPFAASVIHDGPGCQAGKNLVKAIPGGWFDACALGVSGDWVFYVKYTDCTSTGIGEEHILSSVPVFLRPASPNPFTTTTQLEFYLAEGGNASVAVYDVAGHRVARLADDYFGPGSHYLTWDGSGSGAALASGLYFVELRAAGRRSVSKVLLRR